MSTTHKPEIESPANTLLNRELSWVEFNARVLDLAFDETQPLLERVKFCSIFSSNLDEFFMVRVAGLMGQEAAGLAVRSGHVVRVRLGARRLAGVVVAVDGQSDVAPERMRSIDSS